VLAPVPHRQMVFVLPKRLRPYFLWRRKLLRDLARVAARTATTFVRATLEEPELSVGPVLSIQTHGSLLDWRPHVHALVTDGAFRPDGTFVQLPSHSTDVLTEAFRRGVLKLFVDRELFEPEVVAEGMLDWLHSHLQRARRGVAGRRPRGRRRAPGAMLRELPGALRAAGVRTRVRDGDLHVGQGRRPDGWPAQLRGG
jgi:hypothetical protein